MKPLGNRVAVKIIDQQQTSTGIFIPSTMESVQRAKVFACGEGAVTMSGDIIPMEVSVGDVVLVPQNKGIEVTFQDEKVVIYYETDIICIL